MDKKKRGCYKADGLGPGATAPSRGNYRATGATYTRRYKCQRQEVAYERRCLLPTTPRIYLSVANLQPNYVPPHRLQSTLQGNEQRRPKAYLSSSSARSSSSVHLTRGLSDSTSLATSAASLLTSTAASPRVVYLERAMSGSGPLYW